MNLQMRNQYMKAMGIPVWMPRASAIAEGQPDDAAAIDAQQSAVAPAITYASAVQNQAQAPTPATEQNTENKPPRITLEQRLANTVEIPTAPPLALTPAESTPEPAIPVTIAPDCSTLNWAQLQQSVADCKLCGLHKSRTQTVFGTGDTQADWMIIGEAPGAEEDRRGEPFIGRAGKLLNNMLAAVGLPRNAIYISNVLKCRPPNNRDPKADESALCRGYLERQIALVQPKLIIVVGRIAAHNLLHTTTPLGRLRGTVHTLPDSDIPVIVTYHPAYLLRQPAEKRKAWQDLQLARQIRAGK